MLPDLLLISDALSVGDASSLTDFPQKPGLYTYIIAFFSRLSTVFYMGNFLQEVNADYSVF